MSDWIKQEADKIKLQERGAQEFREHARRDEEVIQQKWLDVWRTLVAAIKEDVAVFNAQFPDETEKQFYLETPTGQHITVRRAFQSPVGGPLIHLLAVAASQSKIQVTMVYIHVNESRRSDPLLLKHYWFSVGGDGAVGVILTGDKIATPAELAKAILEHLFS
jgi:hypothetical protein